MAEAAAGSPAPARIPATNAAWFARARRVDPRRCRLAGALLRLGRGHALHRGARRGRLRVGRRGTAATSTSSSPTARSSSATPIRPWSSAVLPRPPPGHDLRGPDRGRGAAGRGDLRAGAGVRAGPPGVVGDRGRHERGPRGAGLHRTRPGREVRRLLPRPRRRAAGRRGERGGHARAAGLGGRARRRRWPTPSSSPTTWCPSSTTRVACVIVEPVAANMGLVAARPGLPRGPAPSVRRRPAPCSSSTR